MEIKFNIDIKVIRKAFIMVDEDVPSDEVINEKMATVVVDLSSEKDPDTKQVELAIAIMAIAVAFGKK